MTDQFLKHYLNKYVKITVAYQPTFQKLVVIMLPELHIETKCTVTTSHFVFTVGKINRSSCASAYLNIYFLVSIA